MVLVPQKLLAPKNKEESKMSMNTRIKTVLGTAIASLTLLTLAVTPSLADTHNNSAIPTTASSPRHEAKLVQAQRSQTTAPTNQTPQQPAKMGCSCCKDMMNNKPEMRNNMPGTMGGQNNQSR